MPVNGDKGHTPARRTQAERSSTTRAALLAAGRELFAQHGFSGTGREDVVDRAGVTRGALQHHFGTKDALFRAVFEQIEQDLMAAVATAAMGGADPLAQVRLGCGAFLDACLDPAVQRIALIDAPAVLGWVTWHEIEDRYALGLVVEGIRHAMDAGQITPGNPEPVARLLLGALTEAARVVVNARHQRAARREVGEVVDRLLAGLAS